MARIMQIDACMYNEACPANNKSTAVKFNGKAVSCESSKS
jgi:hypothetical protein